MSGPKIAGKEKDSRPAISERNKILVWARSAGRCNFCNRLVTENTDLGEPVPIGELAHNVGWSQASPRGKTNLATQLRQEPENLILACRNCHKPIDDGGMVGRYTVEELQRRKNEFEKRIERLTAIGADRAAYVLRVVGDVRGVPAELRRETVLTAATATGIYPHILPGSHWEDVDLDLRGRGDLYTRKEFEQLTQDIKRFVARVHDGIRRDDVGRLAVFAFARIPLLIALGAELDDKVPATIFQRQRINNNNAWNWTLPEEEIGFEVAQERPGKDLQRVALIVNLSGTIDLSELSIDEDMYVYILRPSLPAVPGPTLIASDRTLVKFETAMRNFLAMLENSHGKVQNVDLFPAIPVAPAVTIGRVLMPDISPAWRVFDRDASGKFFLALEVGR